MMKTLKINLLKFKHAYTYRDFAHHFHPLKKDSTKCIALYFIPRTNSEIREKEQALSHKLITKTNPKF
ncbi:hypothetical protein BpHYR1_009011 [Brachionus plicatilis]|uniref:Uncharacterized protein n=1 Tax=Brachionus plicatilis TaxID=10195 RepID=A0A3M7QD70_BRAPC|nr:hypothetical protein BpHYR1_009011 [Brachionus plicatilis]